MFQVGKLGSPEFSFPALLGTEESKYKREFWSLVLSLILLSREIKTHSMSSESHMPGKLRFGVLASFQEVLYST